MILHSPFSISSRLLPCLEIGNASIQLEYSTRPGRDGRLRYRWTIDLPDGTTFSDDDLQTGCQGGTLQDGFCSLLSFLSASAESRNYRERVTRKTEIDIDGNEGLFPPAVVDFACANSDEIGMFACEIEEIETPLIKE
jgi:hypothetical protein